MTPSFESEEWEEEEGSGVAKRAKASRISASWSGVRLFSLASFEARFFGCACGGGAVLDEDDDDDDAPVGARRFGGC